ncbi:GNAT family N-acetyltransferase [Deinococcus sonorensis]|uniref:GNAT family N-acetyltransferase n=2 Tax=Deinococcus sonorensis TaxID=309891 RepID=A0AAU7U4N8_9DEIO
MTISVATDLPAAAYQMLGAFRCSLLGYERGSAERIRAGGLTPQQYALLVMIAGREDEPPSVGEAAQELMLSHNSAVELSQRAEKAGLLCREVDPERGSRTLLTLTPEGAARTDAITRRLISELGLERLQVQMAVDRWRTLLQSGRFNDALSSGGRMDAGPPEFSCTPATAAEQPTVWRLLQLQLHVLARCHGVPVGEDGEYPYPDFGRYWAGAGDQAWLIRVERRPAGLALLHHHADEPRTELAELHLLPDAQGRGVGRAVMRQLFAHHPGRWSVQYHEDDLAARHFWHSVLHGLQLTADEERGATLPLGTGRRLHFQVPAGEGRS